MTTIRTDLTVLGGGAAGLAAAREARRRGASVALVSAGPLGGDCTFTGCVPSKTVIEAARAGLDFTSAFDRARAVVDAIAGTESAEVLTREGVEVIDGEGELVAGSGRRSGAIRVDGTTVEAKGVILALGSRPLVPPIPGLADADPLTSDDLWDLRAPPGSMAVIGGGAIGCELSQALRRLGVAVTLIELTDRLLGSEEPAVSAIVERALIADGVDVRTGVGVSAVGTDPAAGGNEIRLSDGSTVVVDRVLVAVGRTPNSDRGALAGAGIDCDARGYVVVGDELQTTRSGIYAAGDITGTSPFTHAADQMGRLAAGNILARFGRKRFDPTKIPAVTFTMPEAASIGLTEAEAAAEVRGAQVAELPLSAHDRALAACSTDGYIKLIAGPNPVVGSFGGGRLIGATVVAERAGEMIAELALAMRLRAFLGQIALTPHPYPTWSYGIPKAAGQFFAEIDGRRARPAGAASD